MRSIEVGGSCGGSTVVIGARLERLASYCDPAKTTIVTDAPVRSLYGQLFPSCRIIEIGTGEKSKTMETVGALYEAFLRHELDRSSWVAAIGGGIVCDVAGYAASTYLRGLRFGFVPTTLLAQVDASVGGKNGVNFKGYKNLIGTFNQPSFVLCDFNLLRTLPGPELKNGFAEAIKTALIGDADLFSFIEAAWKDALSLEPGVIERIVHDSVSLKARVVTLDEREKGERRKLNLGHTLGHALEKAGGLRHGEAVSVGIMAAARFSARQKLISNDDVERIESLLRKFDLPVRADIDTRQVHDALRRDKKREMDEIHFVLLKGIGNAVVTSVSMLEIEEVIHDLS